MNKYLLIIVWLILGLATGEITGQDSKSGTETVNRNPSSERKPNRSAAEAFPASTMVYAEVQPPSKIVEMILNHRLRNQIESIPQVKRALKSKEFAAFLAAVGFAQFYTGMEWKESLDTLAGKGFAVGFDPDQAAIGAVLMTLHPQKMPDFYRGLLKLANQNEQIKVNEGEYRERKAYSVGEQLFLVTLADRVLVSNRKSMVKKMLDHWLDQPDQCLASQEIFRQSNDSIPKKTAWAWANLKAVRDAGLASNVFREKAENIGAELLVGGVLETIRQSNDLTASFDLQANGLQVSFQTSFDESRVPVHRSYFFGSPDERENFQRLLLENTLGEVNFFRDLGKLWLSKEELFEENHLAELSQADSTLSTLFSGLDFGEEILGSTLPGFQLIARNQDFSQLDTPLPDIKIPEFALVFRLKPENEKVKRRFRVAYQSFIGFLNIQLAMQGQPQLELESETTEKTRIVSATYLPEEGKEDQGLINYNFSPTIAFANQWFIISSTRQMAKDLVQAGQDNIINQNPEMNTSVKVSGKQVQRILEQNSEQLIAQNMLEEGNDREQAKAQIDLVLSLVGLVKNTELQLKNTGRNLQLNLAIELGTESGNESDADSGATTGQK